MIYRGFYPGVTDSIICVVGKNIAIGAEGLRFDSRWVKLNTVLSAATFIQSCVVQALSRGDGPCLSYRLRRNIASIMSILC